MAGLGPDAKSANAASANASSPAAKREAAVLLDRLRKALVAPVTALS
jgi:hypothetical protein